MAFVNRFRLPFKITRPQFLEEREVFRKANGQIIVRSVVIRKQYEGETDHWPEKLHERFKVALAHDNVTIEGERYIGGVVQDGDYTIAWPDFLDYPLGKATFKILATPFDASNSNCGICEDAIQVVANNDDAGTLSEGQTYIINVLSNDDACCYPLELTIVTYDSAWLSNVTILPDNSLSVTLQPTLPAQNSVLILTYRVQCDNGQYDDANVYANIDGSLTTCFAPTQVIVNQIESETAHVTILLNILNPVPPEWEWELRVGFAVIQSGTTTSTDFDLTGLDPSTQYTIYVRGVCGEDDYSNYVQRTFTTDPPSETQTCGSYLVFFNDGSGVPNHSTYINYYDCNGQAATVLLYNMTATNICALQNSPGDPVMITGDPGTNVAYEGLC